MSQTTPHTEHPNDHAREEFINGRLYTSPRPAGPHLMAAYMVGVLLGPPFVLSRGGPGGWWILDEPEILFYRNRFIPDIVGWRRERLPQLPKDPIVDVIPDWVCEVVSDGNAVERTNERLSEASCEARPRFDRSLSRSACLVNGSRKTDRKLKPPIYLQSGVKNMWIIEPEARTVEVYRATPEGWLLLETFSDDDEMRAEPFGDFAIPLALVWGELGGTPTETEKEP